MHELALTNGLMRQIERLAQEHNAHRVTEVTVRLGALSHISASHFREHFDQAAMGSLAQGAHMVIEEAVDIQDPNAQEILLVDLVIED